MQLEGNGGVGLVGLKGELLCGGFRCAAPALAKAGRRNQREPEAHVAHGRAAVVEGGDDEVLPVGLILE